VTDDPVARLKAGLDEDEAVAKAADPGPWMAGAERDHLIDSVVYGQSDWQGHIQQVCNVDYAQRKTGNAAHIARQDPARTLREVEADRKLIDLYERAKSYRDQVFAQPEPRSISDKMRAVTQMLALEQMLKIRAAIYSDEPR
jgi:Family of unknown function (DUF6221)